MRTIVLANTRVVTCDERNTIAGAIAIGDGQLLAVGDRDTVRAAAGPQAQVVDLGGRAVIPGLIDTHPHLLHFGALAEPLVDLADARSQQDIAGRIARRASQLAPGEWLMTTPVGEPHYFIRHPGATWPRASSPTGRSWTGRHQTIRSWCRRGHR
jgi:hypothetical protein